MSDTDTYYINVTFSRSRSDDSEVVRGEDSANATDADLLAQFAAEIQSAYGLSVGMAGHFDIKSLNGAPLTDEQKKAITEAVEKEVASW